MLENELISLINTITKTKSESNNIEVKFAKNGCSKLMDTFSSFSNQQGGGKIVFGIDESNGFSSERGIFKVVLYNSENINTVTVTDPDEKLIIDFCKQPISRAEIEQLFAGKMTIAYVMSKYIHPLIESGAIRLTIPDKPKSKKQRYVAADK